MQNDKAISVLNDLIETCKDGEAGFKTAAEGLSNPEVKNRFMQISRERGQMSTELQAEVRRLGGEPERSGSTAGALHRGWVDIKSAVTGKDDHAIVAEAERGEDAAKDSYESALRETTLPASAQTLIQQQATRVRQAHDEVRNLREREKMR